MSMDTSVLASTLGQGLDLANWMGDSDISRGFGTLMSNALTTTGDSMFNNLLKGQMLTQGLQKDVANSIAGSAVGLAANGIGQGINALGGNSHLSRGIGQGVATGLGTIGGQMVNNLFTNGNALVTKTFTNTGKEVLNKGFGSMFGVGGENGKNFFKSNPGQINPYALGAQVIGSALGAAFGPSKEYGGTYGNITKTMDTVYDLANSAVNFIPGVGQGISGIMTLNKGLSNVFGSTDGMTKQDAILGSAFMPAPIKWLNMAGAKTTSNFEDQSWQNTEKATDFMGSSFGNLNEKFERAKKESGKTYGTFSRGAYKHAQRNLDFANPAWQQILAMADQNELQNIRSQYMSSINNQRYAQMIQGVWQPTYRGKQGMKILNNATNHKVGMRLLSGAALIDDKQMILCNVPD